MNALWAVTEVETLLCVTLSVCVSLFVCRVCVTCRVCRSLVHACYDAPPTLKRCFILEETRRGWNQTEPCHAKAWRVELELSVEKGRFKCRAGT